MTELVTSDKSHFWKRSLLSGASSALVSGACFGILLFGSGVRLGGSLFFLLLGFGFPAFIFPYAGKMAAVMEVAFVWFIIGAAIGYFMRRNIPAIIVWLLVYAISFAITIALYAEIMN